MSRNELQHEMDADIVFCGYEESHTLCGVGPAMNLEAIDKVLRARFQLYHYTIFVGILFAVFTVSGKCTTKKIHISIKRIEGNQIVFTPLTVPEFYGELDGKLDGRIQECTIKKETQGELNGIIVYRAILYCGDAKIKLYEANLE